MSYALFCSCTEIQGNSHSQNQGQTTLEVITTHPLILPVGVGSGRDAEWGPRTCFCVHSWFVLWLGLELISSLRCVLLLLDSDMDTGAKEITKMSLGQSLPLDFLLRGNEPRRRRRHAGSLCLGVASPQAKRRIQHQLWLQSSPRPS